MRSCEARPEATRPFPDIAILAAGVVGVSEKADVCKHKTLSSFDKLNIEHREIAFSIFKARNHCALRGFLASPRNAERIS